MSARILSLCSALHGPRLEDLLVLFSEHEADAVIALLAQMVARGVLRKEGERYFAVGADLGGGV